MRLKLSKLALQDIESIYDHTVAEWGDAQADRYVGALWDAMLAIEKAPERWRLRKDIHPGCRAYLSGSHLIIYRVGNSGIEISRILHGAMNLPNHIPPGFFKD